MPPHVLVLGEKRGEGLATVENVRSIKDRTQVELADMGGMSICLGMIETTPSRKGYLIITGGRWVMLR
jgi:hypothetical protein